MLDKHTKQVQVQRVVTCGHTDDVELESKSSHGVGFVCNIESRHPNLIGSQEGTSFVIRRSSVTLYNH